MRRRIFDGNRRLEIQYRHRESASDDFCFTSAWDRSGCNDRFVFADTGRGFNGFTGEPLASYRHAMR
jgi:hypothetical protein